MRTKLFCTITGTYATKSIKRFSQIRQKIFTKFFMRSISFCFDEIQYSETVFDDMYFSYKFCLKIMLTLSYNSLFP